MSKLSEHEACLREKVFFTDSRWPQYNLLLSDLKALNTCLPKESKVLCQERNVLYGGFSLFAPFFKDHTFSYQDKTPMETEQASGVSPINRGAYNQINDPRFIKSPNTHLAYEKADLVLVPNLLHHIQDQELFFDALFSLGRHIYIFEPLVREIHQAPADYIRYTPDGLRHTLTSRGAKVVWEHEIGGPFTQVLYAFDQAQQYMPESEREPLEEMRKMLAEAMAMDLKYPKNLVREHTRFPTAFSILVKT